MCSFFFAENSTTRTQYIPFCPSLWRVGTDPSELYSIIIRLIIIVWWCFDFKAQTQSLIACVGCVKFECCSAHIFLRKSEVFNWKFFPGYFSLSDKFLLYLPLKFLIVNLQGWLVDDHTLIWVGKILNSVTYLLMLWIFTLLSPFLTVFLSPSLPPLSLILLNFVEYYRWNISTDE